MGLAYAHFGNPKKDYKKSIDFFLRVLNDYPEKPTRAAGQNLGGCLTGKHGIHQKD